MTEMSGQREPNHEFPPKKKKKKVTVRSVHSIKKKGAGYYTQKLKNHVHYILQQKFLGKISSA